MLEVIFKAVHGEFAFNVIAGTACACTVGTAALQHEVINYPVKRESVIESLFDEADKIVYSIGSNIGIKLCFDNVTILHSDGDNRILCHN